MADSTFRVGGLASGLDTNSIIDSLVKLQAQPIDTLKTRQASFQTQVSTLATILSRLSDLSSSASSLATSGTIGTTVTSSNTTFNAVSGTAAQAGTYDVTVNHLATAARARSNAFASTSAPVRGGTLSLTVDGSTTPVDVTIPDGSSLSDVALAIRQSGAAVSAVVLSDGTNAYLSITNRNTGFPLTGIAADALSLGWTDAPGASLGTALLPPDPHDALTQTASNASVTVNDLVFTRRSNTVSDAIPGVTLTLKTLGTSEQLSIDNDTASTTKNLKGFVDSFNGVMGLIQSQLQVSPGMDRSKLLAGDSSVRNLQASLQHLLVSNVGSGSIRTLADLGVKTAENGVVSVDADVLSKAISRDPAAVNDLFSRATTGLGALVKNVVKGASDSVNGTLVLRQKGIASSIKQIDSQVVTMQRRVDAYQKSLVEQFSAMESVVSSLKATGNFLSQQLSAISSTSK
jgi:flagellar hook-associated protein 2